MTVKSHSAIDIYEATRQFWIGDKAGIESLTDISQGSFGFATDTGAEDFGYYDGAAWIWLSDIVGGSISWGDILGTLSDQADLQAALDGKVPTTRTVNGHALSANVTVTKSDVGLGNVTNDAQIAKDGSIAFTGNQSMGGNSLTNVATPSSGNDAANKNYVDAAVVGLFDLKGSLDCSTNPNYPAASKSDVYIVTVAGKVGGASGKSVDIGDLVVALADNAGGTEASVGTSWIVVEHNLVGALIAANNLSDVNADTARTNLGLAIGTNVQAFSADLAAIAGLSPTNDDILQRKSGSWVNRTLAQLITDLTERIQDLVAAFIISVNGSLTINYDDSTNSLGIDINDSYVGTSIIPDYAILYDGWVSEAGITFTYASADDPVYQVYASGDQSANDDLKEGRKFKCTNNSTTFYGIVVKRGAYDAGNNRTPIDIYGGTDYDLANSAITNIYSSKIHAPAGFPLSPAKWTVKVTDTADRTQNTPTTNTWYNLGSLSISIPIGIWNVSYKALARAARAASTSTNMGSTLSTANNSESDTDFTTFLTLGGASGSLILLATQYCLPKVLALTSKTTYYLNGRTTLGADSIGHRGDVGTTVIQAVCAYL